MCLPLGPDAHSLTDTQLADSRQTERERAREKRQPAKTHRHTHRDKRERERERGAAGGAIDMTECIVGRWPSFRHTHTRQTDCCSCAPCVSAWRDAGLHCEGLVQASFSQSIITSLNSHTHTQTRTSTTPDRQDTADAHVASATATDTHASINRAGRSSIHPSRPSIASIHPCLTKRPTAAPCATPRHATNRRPARSRTHSLTHSARAR
mmetsp:Transcript_30177/g.87672  ORF Transcript_30177/g.87672 Transcript_30177/m.87672 type:complete len:209 (+) Transcript_30177:424-1050(+)